MISWFRDTPTCNRDILVGADFLSGKLEANGLGVKAEGQYVRIDYLITHRSLA